ncbi:hypothetical protein GQ457_09G013740 [Hibiscus cannabinus]
MLSGWLGINSFLKVSIQGQRGVYLGSKLLIRASSSPLQIFRPSSATVVKWSPPSYPMVKVNFDASLIPASSIAFHVALLEDHEGFILGANCSLLYNGYSSFVAEAQAAVLGNSNLLGEDRSEIGGHIGDAKILAQNFQNYTFNFIPRAGNSVTHAMARERSFLFEDCTWLYWFVTHKFFFSNKS